MRAERLNAMEQYILGKETVSLEELSTQFSVSMNTIRRDVMELLSRGNIRKVYGGVSSTLINRPVGFSGSGPRKTAGPSRLSDGWPPNWSAMGRQFFWTPVPQRPISFSIRQRKTALP